MSWWRLAGDVAAKDLRIEWRSRVGLSQILPFAGLVMVMFGFALGSDTALQRVAPGLVWMTVIFSLLVMVQRTFAVETADGALDALRTAGVSTSAVFWGKTVALAVQLAVVVTVLLILSAVLFSAGSLDPAGAVLLVAVGLAATIALAAIGTMYGGLATSATGSETLLPLLVLPVVAPVLIGATRAVEAALGIAQTAVADGWPWLGLVSVCAVVFGIGGTLAFGPLIES